MKHGHAVVLGALLALCAGDALAQSTEYELGQIVYQRRPLMFDLQTNYWTLLAVRNGESDDFAGAAAAARHMAEVIGDFVPLMVPGTARGEAPGSRAKPEVWSDADTFAATAAAFRESAGALAEAAESGDAEVYGVAFDAFTRACTGCHGFRPSSGGPFRFGKEE